MIVSCFLSYLDKVVVSTGITEDGGNSGGNRGGRPEPTGGRQWRQSRKGVMRSKCYACVSGMMLNPYVSPPLLPPLRCLHTTVR